MRYGAGKGAEMRDKVIAVAVLVGVLVWAGYLSWSVALCNVKGGAAVMAPLGVVCVDARFVK